MSQVFILYMKPFKFLVMRVPGLLLLSFFLYNPCYGGEVVEPVTLFPVCEKGQYGYVDQKGRMLIKPRFQGVGPFQDGLAPVREDRYYGYIDVQGEYVIEPKFEEAYPFQEDHAVVKLNGRKYLIDKQGEILFEHNYKDWIWAEKEGTQYLIVTTEAGRQGLINKEGEVIIDLIYDQVGLFSEGLASVYQTPIANAMEGKEREVALFNLRGEMVVPFGRFHCIDAFRNGYAIVRQHKKKGNQLRETTGVINRKGELQFLLKDRFIDFIDSDQLYQEGLAEIAIYTVDRDTIDTRQYDPTYVYRGVIDPEGKIVFSHPQVEDITPFEQGRAFAKTSNHAWVLIDRTGKRVGEDYYLAVPEAGFRNGLAVVRMAEGLGVINTDGALLLPVVDLKTTYFQRKDDVVFYEVEILEKDTYTRRWGFWDLQTGYIHPPRYTKADVKNGFQSGLVQVEEDGRQGYVSRKGKYIWRAAKS